MSAAMGKFAISQNTKPVIYLWQKGTPAFENKKDLPEEAKDYWVKSINNPSLRVYAALKEIATGAAVLICPGGCIRLLVVGGERRDAQSFLIIWNNCFCVKVPFMQTRKFSLYY